MNTIIQKPVLTIAMLLTVLTASAYDFEVDGIYYDITSMSDLEVGVTNNGSISSVRPNNSYQGIVTIPPTVNYNNRTFTVTSILPYAMGANNEGCEVTKVILPNTIQTIGSGAFERCSGLVDCNIPESVEVIEAYAFSRVGFTNVVLQNIKTIGKDSFESCPNLQQVVFGKNLARISSQAFNNCRKLTEVFYLGATVPDIASDAFTNAHNGLEFYVPSSAKYGIGKEYLSFSTNSFDYTGTSHVIEWNNNLKAYKCEISEADSNTERNAGQYSKLLTATYSNGVDFSVEIPYEYTIRKAPMTLTVTNAEREYGESNPAFTCNITGFVNGENEQTIGTTPAFECEATKMSKVGNYRILASLEAPNYEVTYQYGTLSIIKAPLTVGVVDASKIYGNQNPEFTYSFLGLKNGEVVPEWETKPVLTTDASATSDVGQYSVTASKGGATNYEITKYNPGTLTIVKRDLTVKANDCERLYNEDNPSFDIPYIGFVNGDSEKSLTKNPVAECCATKSSDAGTYPIVVTGGEAKNYSFVYQDGSLKINPLTIGFKDVYNSVTYNDMTISSTDSYFNYIPEITGPFSDEDFWIELWFLDKDNKYNQHVTTISGGDYAGNYVNTNLDRAMWAGKYIINLKHKGTNPNVTANPARAYLTVNRASNNLEWNMDSPISVKVGEKVDLGISYQADMWCTFNTEYDEGLILLSQEVDNEKNPHWYATGLKEGETTLDFGITCKKNEMGFYNFSDSRTLSKRIKVEPSSGIEGISHDEISTSVIAKEGSIYVLNKEVESIIRVYSIQGTMIAETTEEVICNLPIGLYIVTVGTKSFKVSLR